MGETLKTTEQNHPDQNNNLKKRQNSFSFSLIKQIRLFH